jgi:hypothetical protein
MHGSDSDSEGLAPRGPVEERSLVRRAIPWFASAGVHLALVAAIGVLAVGAIGLRRDRSEQAILIDGRVRAPVPADLERPVPPPPSSPRSSASAPALGAAPAASDALAERLAGRLAKGVDASGSSDRVRSDLDRSVTAASPALVPESPPVSFAGLTQSDARSVVYVVDASGSLVGTLPVVLGELERSLRALQPEQRFAVMFFQRNAALVPPNAGELRLATPAAIDATLAWARSAVRPVGRSNPLAALEQALALDPDVVFLLSTNITGSGEFEIGRDELLDRLDTLNPRSDRTGRRTSRIQCVQFLDPDPLDTLRTIAERHGGTDGYRYLSRKELGLSSSSRRSGS